MVFLRRPPQKTRSCLDSPSPKLRTGPSTTGANSWTWNGQSANGGKMPDGAYNVSVTALGVTGAASRVPFTVSGTATSVQNNAGTVQIQMGGLTLPFSAVQSVGS
jgi:flagellar basal-body rod modification protein FlgD